MVAITEQEFRKLSEHIKSHYGIHLKDEKKTMIAGRLHNVLLEQNFDNFTDYYNYLITDSSGTAARTLMNKITTNHTFFMRESDHFTYLSEQVLPYLKGTVKDRDLRIWSAGCSSGEEPYTIAMLLDEFFGGEKSSWDTKVLATDISDRVLGEAKQGIYSNEGIKKLPDSWKGKYFQRYDSENSQVALKIRDEVIFRKLNLMDKTFPFKRKFHIIFCRNVMIYFDSETKWKLANRFYDMTEYGGYLFIGHSESLDRKETKYRYLMPAVYRKL
ncbi:protein-glutamate O-methyltransferase CheR [Anoxybacterium hadale]|uniref:Protein-glutamate O-methyltransferase CheR n=1 Tax=Anoxybacterium hadale TaxID=3408580 RepID=A0ACD1A6U7_9FIRM|nr:protein-glutamate O-methyltransferase CheR [Clostridiales bacterium]